MALVVSITFRPLAEKLKIGEIASQFCDQLFMLFGYLLDHFFKNLVEGFHRSVLGCCLINGFQIRCEIFSVFVRNIFEGITDLMNDTALIFGIRKGR